MSAPLFDARQVRRAFSRASTSYDAAAQLQHAVEARLLESLDYLDDPALERAPPQRVLDLGCGTGRASRAMQQRWPKAQLVSMDLALPMLRQARAASTRSIAQRVSNPFARVPQQVCADARALPLADASIDVLFSNLCLQWVEDLEAVFAGFRRVLKPDGLLLVSTFGPETLWELRDAFAHADDAPHVSPFVDIAGLGDALVRAGFHQPVLDREEDITHYPDLPALMRELRDIGATNALASRRHTLTGRARFAAAAHAYEAHRTVRGLPATWETVSAMAWAPRAGTPIREGGVDVTAVPLSRIPIRRRA
ncbi:malonyl-ACP O-methyltransferase BioC [Thermomonas sp. HDW16]|uniref:malonyl-ACP O-methyltransferase BioC n=1 Tax=Thermomonas sp. HDW16 TaxID=2714945 RepID=UPI0014080D7A|nr:malonyl-ACP O-methyltransferase BioC [Thermomonas sp. HDW16]QIL19497.1 malonyl-ACP O-methyltransferase BioC [Thermomonas sp. HDW16]